jgi:hypothetical protein
MNSKKLRTLAASGKYIEGVYNYCDRWCERCALSGRCMVFALEAEQKRKRRRAAGRRPDYWNDVEDSLRLAVRILRELAARRGIDLDGEDDLAAVAAHDADLRKHPLAQRCAEYEDLAEEWFLSNCEVIKRKLEVLREERNAGLHEGACPVDQLLDAMETVEWYRYQIGVKLMRALSGETESERLAAADDASGSAKVALIDIDRSLIAWTKLRARFRDEDDAILDMLVLLDRLRRAIETEFPKARAFKRPGFDD